MKEAYEKISLIVPVYQAEKYIRRCLDSIIAQTFYNLEIILVNDGSDDDSGKICDEYALLDKRVKVIHKENGGLSSARNAGLELATGEYIGFIDSDDWIAKDMYEYLYRLIVKYEADIAVGEIVRCRDSFEVMQKKESIEVFNQKEYISRILKVHTRKTEHYACGKLYKATVFENVRYPEGLIAEDVLGTFEAVLQAERVVTSNKVVYFYYINENGITGGKFSKKEFDLLVIWDKVLQRAINNCDKEVKYWALMNRYRADFGILCKVCIS